MLFIYLFNINYSSKIYVCPFLLRVFIKDYDFNNLDGLAKGVFPTGRELHI